MLNRLFNTLFGKLFAGFCLVILLTAAGVWMAAYSAQSQQNEDIGRIEWRFIAHKSVDSAVGIYEVAGRDGLISWLRNERLNTNPIVFVLDSSGREISGRKLPDKAYESLEAIRKLTDDPNGPPEKRLPVRTVEIDNEPCEFFAVRTVAFPVRLIPPELHHFPIALTLSLAAFFTLLVSWLLARLYTRSLHTLDGAIRRFPYFATTVKCGFFWHYIDSAMRRFADGAFDTRTSEELARGDAEVANLARVFDGMADKIESLITRQRRLFHDVSHEVRSPLARIEVALELARRDPARTQDSLGRIEKEVGNINALVESLLTYARLENGANMTKSPVGLADILAGVADDLGFEAQQKNVTVKTVLEGDPVVDADGNLIARAVDNIARNSLRHAPEDSTILLSLSSDAESFIIRCRDEGPGMPEEELAGMFSPFVRGANVRTGTGFGLGLAIARRSVTAHGGAITARNVSPPGLETEIRLPKSIEIGCDEP